MNSTYSKNIKRNKKIIKLIILICILLYLILMFIVIKNISSIQKKESKEKELINNYKELHKQIEVIDKQDNNNITDETYLNQNTIDKNSAHISDNNKQTKSKSNNKGDCIIEIPDINLAKIVYTGKDRETHLENYELVTAADDMEYSQGGNYIICGHASRLYGHSLNRIKEITKGTEILITDNEKTDKYTVNKVYYSNMMDTDKYCRQINKQEITIISCAKYISKESYIVIKAIPNN